MSTKPRAQQPTSVETARAATRELNETIQHAQAVLRELRREREEMEELRDTALADFNGILREMKEHIDGQFAGIRTLLEEKTAEIAAAHAHLLGFKTVDEMLTFMGKQVFAQLQEPVTTATLAALPKIVVKALARMAEMKPTTDAERAGQYRFEITKPSTIKSV